MANPPSVDEIKAATTRVLLTLREGAAEGHRLLANTGRDRDTLAAVLRHLLATDIIFISGELEPDRVGDTYVSLRPSARGRVEQLLAGS